MHGERDRAAVILIGFGGPTAAAEVRPFLDRVLAGKAVPRQRYEEVVRHYEAFGGRSPYNEITMRQAAALQNRLRQIGIEAPVVTGFRYMPPFIDDALRNVRQRGFRRALAFILAAHRCEASWDRYVSEIELARRRLAWDAPEIDYPPRWHNDRAFVEAVADRICAALEQLDPRARERAELIFTAHSIPVAMDGRVEYVEQLNESARLVAQLLGRNTWTLAFQSRSGRPHEPWLEPDIKDVLRRLGGGHAVIVPIGFLCNHVEVLYDLDVEAAMVAGENAVTIVRAATVGDHPKFVELMAQIAVHFLSSQSRRT
jgi:ferrochelatase